MTRAAEASGWGWPLLSKKAHYFVEARSLCGRWMYTGELTDNQGAKSPDDCAACTKKLAKQQQRQRSSEVRMTPEEQVKGYHVMGIDKPLTVGDGGTYAQPELLRAYTFRVPNRDRMVFVAVMKVSNQSTGKVGYGIGAVIADGQTTPEPVPPWGEFRPCGPPLAEEAHACIIAEWYASVLVGAECVR